MNKPLNITQKELEILMYENAVRSQAQQVHRMFQRAEDERIRLGEMEIALQKMRDTYLRGAV